MMDAESTCSVLGLVAEHDSIDEFNAISGACGLSELGRLACASHYFQTALKERSNHVWDRMCESTWDGKVHITHSAIALRKSPNGAREALKSSLADAKRTELTDEELCSLDWRFRFKEQAGPQWQEHDPYWVKREATRVRFGARKAGSPRGPVRMQGFDMIEAFQLEWEWRHPYRHLFWAACRTSSAGHSERQPRSILRGLSPRGKLGMDHAEVPLPCRWKW